MAQKGLNTGEVEQQYQFATEEQRQAYDTAQRQVQEQRDTVQRKYAQQIAELETQASRGDVSAQAQLSDLQRRLQESIKSTGLTAEKFFGSSMMPSLEGYSPLGGVSGTLAEQKVSDISQRRSSIYDELTQASLPV